MDAQRGVSKVLEERMPELQSLKCVYQGVEGWSRQRRSSSCEAERDKRAGVCCAAEEAGRVSILEVNNLD